MQAASEVDAAITQNLLLDLSRARVARVARVARPRVRSAWITRIARITGFSSTWVARVTWVARITGFSSTWVARITWVARVTGFGSTWVARIARIANCSSYRFSDSIY